MELSGNYAYKKPSTLTTRLFRGLRRGMAENNLSIGSINGKGDPICYTPSSVNALIIDGKITVRNNYELVVPTTVTADMNDGYTYKIKSQFVYAPNTASEHRWLLGVQALSGTTHHHYCLLHRKYDLSDSLAEVKCATLHSLGTSSDSMWFANANFDFVNYSGNFLENGVETFATAFGNGADMLMFYTPSGLSVLGSSGWKNITVDATLNTLTATSLATLDDKLQFYSRTQAMPGGVSAWTTYYAVNVVGNTFQISLTSGGSPIDITSVGANVVGRLVTDYGAWKTTTVNSTTGVFTIAGTTSVDGIGKMFRAVSGSLPKGILPDIVYYLINSSGATFKLSTTVGGDAITVQSAGNNFQCRSVIGYPKDAPRLAGLSYSDERMWGYYGDTVYYNAGFIDRMSEPNDWTTALLSGNIPKPTWDGVAINAFKVLNGRKLVFKENCVFAIQGKVPPYNVEQLYSAVGTNAPKSVCEHGSYGIFWATPSGIVRFNGVATEPYLTSEISGIWYPDNTTCKSTIVDNIMLVYGQFYHPETHALGYGILWVDLATANALYQDMSLGAATLTVDCVMPPQFTKLRAGVLQPQFWFACGDAIYRLGVTTPAAGAAPSMFYMTPESDYGSAKRRKSISSLTITGSGGTLTVTPYSNGTAKTAKDFELPAKSKTMSVSGERIKFKLSSANDPMVIEGKEEEYA
jgi:hypothetical protein